MKSQNQIQKLTDREHIILRPSMYIGSVSNEVHEVQVFDNAFTEPKLVTKELKFAPGLIKIINEVIDNSVDAIIKTGVGDKVKVTIDATTVKVEDNSTGFPLPKVEFLKEQTIKDLEQANHIPLVLALGNARAGSNFNDEENQGQMGTNGVGAFASNCFSLNFVCTSINQDYKIQAGWKDNGIFHQAKISKTTANSGTTVVFEPDLLKFNQDFKLGISQDIHEVIIARLQVLSLTYPKIKFFFNNNKIQQIKKLNELFTSDNPFVEHTTENYKILVIANNEKTNHFSVVNGLQTPDGGTHIDVILQDIVKALQETRGLNCTRADVLNTLQIMFVGSGWRNLRFNSQTKEKITNSTKETRDYLGDFSSLVTKIQKSKEIKEFIKASTQARELRTEKKALKEAKKSKIKSDKFLDSQGTRETLMIVEGDSAMGGLAAALGRKGIAYYALKGKPLNVQKSTAGKVANNKELSELLSILHQSDFKQIVLATDQDLDGFHIRGLLLGFVNKFLPELRDRVYFLQTPVRGIYKNGKLQRWSFDLETEIEVKSGETPIYLKGLGSLDPSDLDVIIKKNGMQTLLTKVDFTGSESSLEAWLGDDSDIRKEMIKQNDFSIAKA